MGVIGYTGSLKTKIDSLIAGAKDRANHTGTQSVGTITGLAAVATSAAYADLQGRPTIPTAYTDEQAQDAAASLLTSGAHTGISFAYDDAGNRVNATVTGGTGGGSYTDEQAQDAAAALFAAGSHSGITFAYDDAGNKMSATVTATGGSGGSGGATFKATDYGISTSSSDIGPAVNALINTITTNGGGAIEFPAGNYSVGTQIVLKQGVWLIGNNPVHGYIAASPSAQTVKFSQNAGMTGYMVKSQGGWAMGVQGIDVSGNGNVNSGGIWLDNTYWGGIKQSMANGFGQSGFKVTGGFANALEDLMTTNCVDASVTTFTGALDIDGTDHYVSRCEFACRGLSTGIANTNKYVVAMAVRGSNHFVDTVVGETSDKGFYITATKSRFVNLRADTNNGDGFHVVGGTNSFANCDAIGNSQAGTNQHDGWIIENGAWRCRFVACTVSLAGSIKCRYGFREETNIAQPVYAPVFEACSVEDAGTARWYQPNGSFAGITFTGTMKPAQGATPDAYETALMDTSNFTAATTITNFVGGAEGQHLRVIGNANITIASGSTIKTSTGANVAMVANKIYSFTYYHGVWYGA